MPYKFTSNTFTDIDVTFRSTDMLHYEKLSSNKIKKNPSVYNREGQLDFSIFKLVTYIKHICLLSNKVLHV